MALPLRALNHISWLVKDVKESATFYESILGFVRIKRPESFEFEGAWLHNYGIGIHLIVGNPLERPVEIDPRADHLSFQADSLEEVESRLRSLGIQYEKRTIKEGGVLVTQLFFHDPDRHMIEICNCELLPVEPIPASVMALGLASNSCPSCITAAAAADAAHKMAVPSYASMPSSVSEESAAAMPPVLSDTSACITPHSSASPEPLPSMEQDQLLTTFSGGSFTGQGGALQLQQAATLAVLEGSTPHTVHAKNRMRRVCSAATLYNSAAMAAAVAAVTTGKRGPHSPPVTSSEVPLSSLLASEVPEAATDRLVAAQGGATLPSGEVRWCDRPQSCAGHPDAGQRQSLDQSLVQELIRKASLLKGVSAGQAQASGNKVSTEAAALSHASSSALTDSSSDGTISVPSSSACASTRTSSDEGAGNVPAPQLLGTKAGAGKQPGILASSPFQSVL